MPLTTIQRDAVKAAQQGNWDLADAMEVQSYQHTYKGDLRFRHGIRSGGRLRLLVFSNAVAYDEDGLTEDVGDDIRTTVYNPNGERVYDSNVDDDDSIPRSPSPLLTPAWAANVLAEYHRAEQDALPIDGATRVQPDIQFQQETV